MDKKKIIIITCVFICILIGIFICVKCFKNENINSLDNENEYIESLDIDLNSVLKKDKKLILEAMNNIPYANGLYQSIYTDSLKIENIKSDLLFYKAYYTDIKKIEKDTLEYNNIVDNITFDFLIKKDDILNKIYELYDIKLDSLNSNIELIDKKATLYNDYYGFNDYSNTSIYKISKVENYIIGNDNLVIYERVLFYTYDEDNKIINIYDDDKLSNKILQIDDTDLDLNKIKDIFNKNKNSFNTYEHTFTFKNNKYYWYSIIKSKELEK